MYDEIPEIMCYFLTSSNVLWKSGITRKHEWCSRFKKKVGLWEMSCQSQQNKTDPRKKLESFFFLPWWFFSFNFHQTLQRLWMIMVGRRRNWRKIWSVDKNWFFSLSTRIVLLVLLDVCYFHHPHRLTFPQFHHFWSFLTIVNILKHFSIIFNLFNIM